ncbi:MAG: hypothetical protein R2849_05000 [Thermomicrobiales bacterium]
MNVAVAGDGTVTDVSSTGSASSPDIVRSECNRRFRPSSTSSTATSKVASPIRPAPTPTAARRILIADGGNNRIQIYANTGFTFGGPV